jgi:hypothetical protein
MPNRHELQCTIDYQAFNPTIDTAIFPDAGDTDGYWSSTTVADSPIQAWIAHFTHGIIVTVNKTGTMYVRCVRGGQ